MHLPLIIVSIPFKRESLSKVRVADTDEAHWHGFNSLQTGKPIQSETYAQTGKEKSILVSISFKRESLSKGGSTNLPDHIVEIVSIPFKRESLSKVRQ